MVQWGLTPLKECRQLRARRALSQFNNVPLRTRWALSLYKVYGSSTLLVLNGNFLNSVYCLPLMSFWFSSDDMKFVACLACLVSTCVVLLCSIVWQVDDLSFWLSQDTPPSKSAPAPVVPSPTPTPSPAVNGEGAQDDSSPQEVGFSLSLTFSVHLLV